MISLVFNTQKEQEGTGGDDDEEDTYTVEQESNFWGKLYDMVMA